MVTNDGPQLVYLQVTTSAKAKGTISAELVEMFRGQDLRVYDLLLRYRDGEPVAEEILSELLPMVRAKAGRLRPVGLYGRGDLQQELVTDVFHVAERMVLTRPDFVTRRLMLAAAKRLARRLEREWHRQLDQWYRQSEVGPEAESDATGEEG
jgi:hypothetical protein